MKTINDNYKYFSIVLFPSSSLSSIYRVLCSPFKNTATDCTIDVDEDGLGGPLSMQPDLEV
jgi:hypothetical protein